MKSSLLICILIVCAVSIPLKKSLPNLTLWRITSIFSFESFVVLVFYSIFWDNFCIWCEIGLQIHPLCVDIQLSEHCSKDYFFFHCKILALSKINWPKHLSYQIWWFLNIEILYQLPLWCKPHPRAIFLLPCSLIYFQCLEQC